MKKYNNPPEKSDFEYFQNFSDFQIVVLCEFELLRKNKKFTRVSTEFYKSLIKGILSKINSYIEVIVVIGPDEQDLVDEYSKLTNKDISIYIGVDINETLKYPDLL